jgi:hypothetical protein
MGVFIIGALLGYLPTTTLPELALVNLYQQGGMLGLIGGVAIALMLVGIPLTYTAWISGGIVQTSRPRQPMENESLPIPKGKGEFQHVLVPAGGGPQAFLGLRLATKLSSRAERVPLSRVLPPSAEAELADQRRALRRMIEENLGSALGSLGLCTELALEAQARIPRKVRGPLSSLRDHYSYEDPFKIPLQ